MPGACWAETAEEASVLLEQAEQYVREANYPDAEAIYKSVVADYPGTDDAFTAQGRLAMLYLRWGNQAEAEAACDRLASDFSQHEEIVETLNRLAEICRRQENYAQARELYKWAVENRADGWRIPLGAAAFAIDRR